MSEYRPTLRTSFRIGPLVVLWLDLWTNRYGLDFELTIRRRIYSLEFGFGHGIRTRRGYA